MWFHRMVGAVVKVPNIERVEVCNPPSIGAVQFVGRRHFIFCAQQPKQARSSGQVSATDRYFGADWSGSACCRLHPRIAPSSSTAIHCILLSIFALVAVL